MISQDACLSRAGGAIAPCRCPSVVPDKWTIFLFQLNRQTRIFISINNKSDVYSKNPILRAPCWNFLLSTRDCYYLQKFGSFSCGLFSRKRRKKKKTPPRQETNHAHGTKHGDPFLSTTRTCSTYTRWCTSMNCELAWVAKLDRNVYAQKRFSTTTAM